MTLSPTRVPARSRCAGGARSQDSCRRHPDRPDRAVRNSRMHLDLVGRVEVAGDDCRPAVADDRGDARVPGLCVGRRRATQGECWPTSRHRRSRVTVSGHCHTVVEGPRRHSGGDGDADGLADLVRRGDRQTLRAPPHERRERVVLARPDESPSEATCQDLRLTASDLLQRDDVGRVADDHLRQRRRGLACASPGCSTSTLATSSFGLQFGRVHYRRPP